MDSSQETSVSINNKSLLDRFIPEKRKEKFWLRKQEKEEVKQEHKANNNCEKRPKVIIQKGLPENINPIQGYRQDFSSSKRSIYRDDFTYNVAQAQKIQFYAIVGELKQIEDRSVKLKKSMSNFVCWATVILLSVIVIFIVLLKTFLFFNTQLVGTIVESFKDQLFDPKVTNDQLQLQVFYVQQGFFMLTVVFLILFILTCTLMVSKHYQHRLRKYKLHKQQIRQLKNRKQNLLNEIKSFALEFNNVQ